MSAILTIETSDEGKAYLQNYPITIVKPDSQELTAEYIVIAAVIKPFTNSTTLHFNSEEGKKYIYASDAFEIRNFELLTLNLTELVDLESVYVFNGQNFEKSNQHSPKNSLGINNERIGFTDLVCGMAETLSIDEVSPSITIVNSVISLPVNNTALIFPSNILFIFTSQGLDQNMILESNILYNVPHKSTTKNVIISTYLKVDLRQDQTIYFDLQTKIFTFNPLPI